MWEGARALHPPFIRCWEVCNRSTESLGRLHPQQRMEGGGGCRALPPMSAVGCHPPSILTEICLFVHLCGFSSLWWCGENP